MKYFSEDGRRIPSAGMRVFSQNKTNYYKFKWEQVNFEKIHANLIKYANIGTGMSSAEFTKRAKSLYKSIQNNRDYSNITNGFAIPFIMPILKNTENIGSLLEGQYLPFLQNAFEDKYNNSKFKAVLQGQSKLIDKVEIEPNSNNDRLIKQCLTKEIICWLFPEAFSGYDIYSQRKQIQTLPLSEEFRICLSGGIDIVSAAIGTPSLFINENDYAPIICMSGYIHKDPRLVMLLKAYGPHLEFWCMSQMLSPTVTQVSEQWTGSLTVFEA